MSQKTITLLAAALSAALLAGCETTNMRMGSAESKTVATGAAAGESSANANTQLERCASPLGTVSLALPVMETLSALIAGTQSMVLLTDAQGVVLHALGDEEFLGRAHRVALRPGGTWSERSKGTNAIGTALALGDAVQVNGDEHFLAANQFLTCSCAPICDPLGQVIGALDVSGDRHQQSAHTLALVRMSARMVENHLFGKVYEDAVRLRFHARPEFLGTLVEGLAAFTPEGRFLAANRSGQFQLGMSANALQAQTFPSLFGMPMSALLAHARGAMPRPLQLALPGGVVVNAMVEFRPKGAAALGWLVQGRDEDAPAPPPVAPASAAATVTRPRRALQPQELALARPGFDDERLEELAWRFRARNFPETLDEADRERWEALRVARLMEGEGGGLTFDVLFARLDTLGETADERGEAILGALYEYAESIAPDF
ncbi:GAF domain-containing protein [Paracidovorax oryzae]|uniref:sigma-54-dependent Fis family transcriptional regulator n=1 Tax=Paracidovorax oryzae TaxID=862720 RepID=UPI0003061DC9